MIKNRICTMRRRKRFTSERALLSVDEEHRRYKDRSSHLRRCEDVSPKMRRSKRERESSKESSDSDVLDVSEVRFTGRAMSLSQTHWFSAAIIIGQVESSDAKALPNK
jgi:hypothetical protein